MAKEICTKFYLFIVGLICISIADSTEANQNVSILAFGLAGVGKSATISTLLHKSDLITVENDFQSSLQEYSISLSQHNYYLKIIDSTGFVVGTGPETDGQTLAVLSNYLKTMEQNHELLNFLLIISSFDDSRASGESSNFVQMLKRAELLKLQLLKSGSSIFNNTNCIFLFTQVGRATKSQSRRPQGKLALFKDIIRNFTTSFPEPIELLIGENDSDGYDLTTNDDGFIQLPNNNLYPKNLLEKMINMSQNASHSSILRNLLQNYKSHSFQITTKSIPYDNSQSETAASEFTQQILGQTIQAGSSSSVQNQEENEISKMLSDSWNKEIDATLKQRNPAALQLLIKIFQQQNITKISELPKTTNEIVKLYLSLPNQQEIYDQLLRKAFNIEQPHLNTGLITGYGYDLTTDAVLESTPLDFTKQEMKSTELGFKLPANYIVTSLDKKENVFHSLPRIEDYLSIRLGYLENAPTNAQQHTNFKGSLRLAYNAAPENPSYFTISSIKEFHKFKLEIDDGTSTLQLNERFIERLKTLKAFDSSDRESEKEWKNFFNEYGTHIVTSAFGGGYMQATLEVRTALNTSALSQLSNVMVQSPTHIPTQFNNKISYSFFGGSPTTEMEHIYNLNADEQLRQMEAWEKSARLNPIVMENWLRLKSISEIASIFNQTIGENIEATAQLLYNGKLKYERPRRPKLDSNFTNAKPSEIRQSMVTATSTQAPVTTTTTSTTITTTTTTSRPWYSWSSSVNSKKKDEPLTPKPSNSNPVKYARAPTIATIQQVNIESSSCPHNYEALDTSNKIRPKRMADYDVPVGNGYNMFYDSGVPTSPFKMGNTIIRSGAFEYNGHLSITTAARSHIDTCNLTNSYAEYIKQRIGHQFKKWSDYWRPINESIFDLKPIKPGYSIITDWKKTNQISSSLEEIFFKLFIDDWRELEFSEEFVKDVENLPKFKTGDCNVKQNWKDFLNKYGTHVILARNAGISTEVRKLVKLKANVNKSGHFCHALTHSIRLAHNAVNEGGFYVNRTIYHHPSNRVDVVWLNAEMELFCKNDQIS